MDGGSARSGRATRVVDIARRTVARAKPTTSKGKGGTAGAAVAGTGGAIEVASGSGSASGLTGAGAVLFWLFLGTVVAAAVVLAVENAAEE